MTNREGDKGGGKGMNWVHMKEITKELRGRNCEKFVGEIPVAGSAVINNYHRCGILLLGKLNEYNIYTYTTYVTYLLLLLTH